jgi:hypothetical protein
MSDLTTTRLSRAAPDMIGLLKRAAQAEGHLPMLAVIEAEEHRRIAVSAHMSELSLRYQRGEAERRQIRIEKVRADWARRDRRTP